MRTLPTVLSVAFLLVAAIGGSGVALASTDATQSNCEFPHAATDATGTEVSLSDAPDRVVALQPSDAQTMWEIGARDQVVGMPLNQYTDYLNDTGDRTNVANDDGSTNVEAVVGAEPDLVLAANATSADTVQQLRDAGLTVYHFSLVESLDGIAEQTTTIGRLTGNCDGASETVTEMQDRIQNVRDAVGDRDEVSALYYFFDFTTGNETHIHDAIETAGGQNVAAEAGITGYAQISPEIVADQDPQWIVYPSSSPRPSGDPYNGTTAVQQDQVLKVNDNYISQPAPRVLIAVEQMAEAFHPEAFAEQSPTESATPNTVTESETPDTMTESETPDTMTESETAETPTAGSGPGFGVVGAFVALVATLALAGRRKGT